MEPLIVISVLKQLSAPEAEKTILLDWLESACLLRAQMKGAVVSEPLLSQLKQQLNPVLLRLAGWEAVPQNRGLCQQLELQISFFYKEIVSVTGQSPAQLLLNWKHAASEAGSEPGPQRAAACPMQADNAFTGTDAEPSSVQQPASGYSRYE
ncbi:hypothetical protein [Rheinheimera sp.]|uniref:hypothetical protein n=1 Tax=Rheinheimera sp. TaxID=1869214 RepID=UPI00307F134D